MLPSHSYDADASSSMG